MSRKRRVAAWVLLVLAVLITPITLATRWVNFEITSEERFVNTLAPLADDPQVQEAVADRVTQLIFDNVDVSSLAEDALPEQADFLAAPLAAGVESFTNEQALRFTQSEQFSELWRNALVVAHRAMDALLTGKDDGAVRVEDGEVVLDLTTVVQAVVDELSDRGLTFVDSLPTSAISGQIVLFESQALADAQSAVEALNTLSWALLVIALVFYGTSIVLLGDGRRGFLRVGSGLAVGGLLLGVMLATGRGLYLDAVVSAGADRTVQTIVFDHTVASLRTALRAVIALGVVVAVVAWVLGPSSFARSIRSLVGSGLGKGAEGAGALGAGDQPWLRWIGRHERGLQVAVGVVAAMVFLTRNQPSAGTVLTMVLVTAVLLGLLSIAARTGRAGGADPDDDGDAPDADAPEVDGSADTDTDAESETEPVT